MRHVLSRLLPPCRCVTATNQKQTKDLFHRFQISEFEVDVLLMEVGDGMLVKGGTPAAIDWQGIMHFQLKRTRVFMHTGRLAKAREALVAALILTASMQLGNCSDCHYESTTTFHKCC